MARRTDTRRRMLESAADLFHVQGYHATGLNQLTAAGGAPKGSLYFHFPGGKEQLAAEAVEVSGARWAGLLKEALEAAPDPATAIESVIETLAHNLTESDFQRGCPISNVALDAARSEPIRHACEESYASWREVIEEYLVAQGMKPDRAGALSMVALSAIEGALLLAKIHRDLAPLRTVGEYLKKDFA
ncbi:TetR/AcrR family transcriptional regulator [Amycolatopsis taiwanensis]|uniref:TetR/AcrR family transcriptional regulator n=1 Tax=Amycolatopsis taiwanensis TaxID=342230 RepID=UPI00047FC276|nr:TetR/AcrR family transcriptional regulator [Amycolatopsis taiwanensis]